MNNENFAMQLVEKQMRREEIKFYVVCALFLAFMFFAYLYPETSSVDASQEVNAHDNVNVTSEIK